MIPGAIPGMVGGGGGDLVGGFSSDSPYGWLLPSGLESGWSIEELALGSKYFAKYCFSRGILQCVFAQIKKIIYTIFLKQKHDNDSFRCSASPL